MTEKARKKTGPKSLYSPELVDTLCAAYSLGIGLRDTANSAGISYETLRNWRKESREHPRGPKGGLYPKMRDALARRVAQATQEKKSLDPGWWLAHVRPKRWGAAATRLEHSGPGGGAIPVEQRFVVVLPALEPDAPKPKDG